MCTKDVLPGIHVCTTAHVKNKKVNLYLVWNVLSIFVLFRNLYIPVFICVPYQVHMYWYWYTRYRYGLWISIRCYYIVHVMCTPCWSWSNWKLENYANAVHHVDKEGGHSYLLLLPPSMTHLLSTNVLLHCWAQWIPGIHWAVPFSHCVVWPPPEPFLLNTRFSHPCSTTNDESPTTCCPLL